jgi:hypothetical protein
MCFFASRSPEKPKKRDFGKTGFDNPDASCETFFPARVLRIFPKKGFKKKNYLYHWRLKR